MSVLKPFLLTALLITVVSSPCISPVCGTVIDHHKMSLEAETKGQYDEALTGKDLPQSDPDQAPWLWRHGVG